MSDDTFEKALAIYKYIRNSGLGYTDEATVRAILACVEPTEKVDVPVYEPKQGDLYTRISTGIVWEITGLDWGYYKLSSNPPDEKLEDIKVSPHELKTFYEKVERDIPRSTHQSGDVFKLFSGDHFQLGKRYGTGEWQYTFTTGPCTGESGYVDDTEINSGIYEKISPETTKTGDVFRVIRNNSEFTLGEYVHDRLGFKWEMTWGCDKGRTGFVSLNSLRDEELYKKLK